MMDTAISQRHAPPAIPGYELKQLVGKGGMGEVHMATQLSLQRTVAVKLLKHELAKDEQFIGRFEKEGAALATLRHPQIVSIVDRGKQNDTYYLVMEFVDGPSLREKMREPHFDSNQALVTMLLVARAIDYAHGRGVIHRDLKPENILFDEQAGSIPKVTDFGLAGLDESHGPLQRNLTQTHVSMGTASYMAPEQAVDAKSAGPRADLYSIGVMLYETLTGELPIGQFDPPSTKKPDLDKRLDAIISRCLKPNPDDRYPTASALIDELEKVVQVSSYLSKSKETQTQRLVRRAREFGRKVGRAASMGVVLLSLGIVGASFLERSTEKKRLPSGVALMTDFGARFPLTSPGRVDKKTRDLTLGEGPDTVGLMALGRRPEVKGGEIDFGQVDGDANVGRVVIDADVVGAGVEFSAVVDTQDSQPGRFEPLWRLFRGARPESRSALMLLGKDGRYVALVVSGGQAEPTLEWALGPDKRGLMQAPLVVKREGQRLSMRVDPEKREIFAMVGEGRDARGLGDGLGLGPEWLKLLGESPRLAVGCLEGRCIFRQLKVQGLEVATPLPPRVDVPDAPVVNKVAVKPVAAKPAPKPAPKPAHKPAPRPKKR